MTLLRCSLAASAICCATLALAAVPASAEITLVNAGFESGDTTGWSGSGTAAAGYGGFTAAAGSYFGLVRSPGCPGERLEQQFTADVDDVLTGWAFFATTDYMPWDDAGDVRVVVERTASDTVVFSSTVGEVGDYGSTPWTPFSYEFHSPGSYVLQLRVDNGNGDCSTESAVGLDMAQGSLDVDTDEITDDIDNCKGIANRDQLNQDGDERGDACDADDDNDTFDDESDNCPLRANSAQADTDADGLGDACDADDDNDAVDDGVDDCQFVGNTAQFDNDADRQGDACDTDDDNDTVLDVHDNCPMIANAGQRDDDHDGIGNVCDEAFDSTAGRAGAGGWIRRDGERVSFSVSAKSKHGVLAGTCRITVNHTTIRCVSLDGYHYDAADQIVVLVGTATVDGTPTSYRIVLRDTDDRFRITTDSGFVAGGAISGGRVRIRQG
jgi:hypothetical protein